MYVTRPADSLSRVVLCSGRLTTEYGELIEPHTKGKQFGAWSFCVVMPTVCEQATKHLSFDNISRGQFICELKTVLFARVYLSEAPLRK